MKLTCVSVLLATFIFVGCNTAPPLPMVGESSLSYPKEVRISNLRQLTFEGLNSEAYWSPDQRWLSFQHTGEDAECDQIFKLSLDGKVRTRVSNGKGRTTSSYFSPNGNSIFYSSTHAASAACPKEPERTSHPFSILNTYQFYRSDLKGERTTPMELGAPQAYNAEMTACKNGRVIFTSDRNGDLDLYTGQLDRDGYIQNIKQITDTFGYDGGATFSPDCSKITWKASRPKPGREAQSGTFEIWLADSDGKNSKQVTHLGATSFSPVFTPDSSRILFSSNLNKKGTHEFDLYLIRVNGTDLEQVTYSGSFDGFPMFSPDGKYLAFTSGRYARRTHETNIFVADWNAGILPSTLTDQDPFPQNRIYALIQELGSNDLEGRGVATKGIERTESYINDHFERRKLKTWNEVFGTSTRVKEYEQEVSLTTSASANWKDTTLKADWKGLKGKDDFAPASFSSEKKFQGELLDIGYGLTIRDKKWDDYVGKSTKGKILLIRKGVPADLKLNQAEINSYSDLRFKAYLAKEKKAAGILFWDPSVEGGASEDLTTTLSDSSFDVSGDAGIPVLFLSKKLANEFQEAPKKIHLSGGIKLDRKIKSVSNMIGVIGERHTCSSKRPVVLGAHIDSLGYGGIGSLDNALARVIHPGADDNASGVAALLEVTRKLSSKTVNGCYVVVGFTGKEVGLLGSARFMDLLRSTGVHPKAMLNLDMVGRMQDNRLFTFGSENAAEWDGILKSVCENHALNCESKGESIGQSDQIPFTLNEIPSLHFFTGTHDDYHRSSDTVDRINTTGVLQVAELVADVALKANQTSFTFQQSKAAATENSVPLPVSSPTPSGAGVLAPGVAYLGTTPDMSASALGTKGGVKLRGARVGSPAELAGVRSGDIVVGITIIEEEPGVEATEKKTYDIGDLQDYNSALGQLKPEQRIRLRLKRGKLLQELLVTVGRKI